MPQLSMPLFVNPQDVVLRMQLDAGLTGVNDIVSSGIIGAQLHVERIIDSQLCRTARNNAYFIDSESFSGIAPNGLYRIEIPSGLVRKDAPYVVEGANSGQYGPFGSYSTIDPGLMVFDYPRGYLYLDANTYGDYHLKVQCETGFEDGTRPLPVDGVPAWTDLQSYAVGDTVVYAAVTYQCKSVPPPGTAPPDPKYWTLAYVPQEAIPGAIYEAILALVPMVFNSQQTTNRNQEAQSQYQMATDHANMLLQPYARLRGFSFRAL